MTYDTKNMLCASILKTLFITKRAVFDFLIGGNPYSETTKAFRISVVDSAFQYLIDQINESGYPQN
jgi:hypothetical protein